MAIFKKENFEKILKNKSIIVGIIISVLGLTAGFSIAKLAASESKNSELTKELETMTKNYNKATNHKGILIEEKSVLEDEVEQYKLSEGTIISENRDRLVSIIKEAVNAKGVESNNSSMNIDSLDALRALKSAENRIIAEYSRVVALVLATMDMETDFSHKSNTNPNGTVDHGIMQVNDAIIGQVKEALGNGIDPVNNRADNVEAGSWEIYECYLKAKEKHPDDVIWWTYAYYNRGMYFESTDAWKDPNHPSYKKIRNQANERSQKFKADYERYYNVLSEEMK